MSDSQPKKRGKIANFFRSFKDAYTLTKRSYKAIGWILLGSFLATVAVFEVIGLLINHWIYMLILGIFTGLLIDMIVLSRLMNKSMYKQLEGHNGAVGAILTQLGRGWVIPDQPVAVTKQLDSVWRLIGKPGVVLIGEGAHGRLNKMMSEESVKIRRAASGVPIHRIEVGSGKDQVSLEKMMKTLKKLPKGMNKNDIPAVRQRLASLDQKALPIPKGVDPTKAKFSRRALRGK